MVTPEDFSEFEAIILLAASKGKRLWCIVHNFTSESQRTYYCTDINDVQEDHNTLAEACVRYNNNAKQGDSHA